MEITIYNQGKVVVGINRLPGHLTEDQALDLAESMVREREIARNWRLVARRGASRVELGVFKTPYWFTTLEYLDLGQPERQATKVCQDCFAQIRPDDYFPWNPTDGYCSKCGDYGFVARVRKDEI